jgi:hypothetical protein
MAEKTTMIADNTTARWGRTGWGRILRYIANATSNRMMLNVITDCTVPSPLRYMMQNKSIYATAPA